MLSDIEIARSIKLRPIADIARETGINPETIEPYGRYIAKVPLSAINTQKAKNHKLILVTAISPTKAGNGKTTVSVGLALGMKQIGKHAILALREPSLGPCFGMKGGAAGGGYAQVLPMEKINLHFTGDFHAITSAHNMIAALLDNYIYQHAAEGFGLSRRLWKRVLDVNDRQLRHVITGLGGPTSGIPAETGFDITPASELMAIFCLSTSLDDMRQRIDNILLGYTLDKKPFFVRNMQITGSIVTLLADAIAPNLVQTTESTAAFIHGGPFANIAHGCNSVIATTAALTYGDYAITEAGFGADLGAEKFFDIKCRTAGLSPALSVLVVTAQALKMHGGAAYEDIKKPDHEALTRGFWNMDRHIRNLQQFGQTVVVAFNRYGFDTNEEIDLVRNHCQELGIGFAVNNAYAEGGKGATELATLVAETIEHNPSKALSYAYPLDATIEEKAEAIAKNIYGAGSVSWSPAAKKALKLICDLGVEKQYPICIAKTQYSLSTNANAYGNTDGFDLEIRDIEINNGAQMIVLIASNIMRMPGLPKTPQALNIDIDVQGNISGLS